MRLPDLAPLLVKGLCRAESATHAARALAAVAPVVGVGRRWGGRRALALVVAGLLPVVRRRRRRRGGRGEGRRTPREGRAGKQQSPRWFRTPPTPATGSRARTAPRRPRAEGRGPRAGRTESAGRLLRSLKAARSRSPAGPSVGQSPRIRGLPPADSGPLGVGEGAAAGRWLAAGPGGGARGRNDLLAAALESTLPSPDAPGAVPRGKRHAVARPIRADGIVRLRAAAAAAARRGEDGRLAEIVADALAEFVFPDHAVPVVRVLVDVAAAAQSPQPSGRRAGRRGDRERAAEESNGPPRAAAAAAARVRTTRRSRRRPPRRWTCSRVC